MNLRVLSEEGLAVSMMSLIGKYTNRKLRATLEITSAYDVYGAGIGTFTFRNRTYGVSVHYNFQDNFGDPTVLQIWAIDTCGYQYLGAAGSTPTKDGSQGIELAGGVSTVNSTEGFHGLFTKAV